MKKKIWLALIALIIVVIAISAYQFFWADKGPVFLHITWAETGEK